MGQPTKRPHLKREPSVAERKMLEAMRRLGDWATVEQIAAESKLSDRWVRTMLQRGTRLGQLETKKLPGFGGPKGYRLRDNDNATDTR